MYYFSVRGTLGKHQSQMKVSFLLLHHLDPNYFSMLYIISFLLEIDAET